jgi:hypothetical protein
MLSLWTDVSTVSTKWDASVSMRVCFLSIKENAWFQPTSSISRWTARSWGPADTTGNGLLYCLLHCGHFCNGISEWSLLLTDQCLWRALINAHYRYDDYPYSNLPVADGILEPARIWQPPGAASWNQPGYGSHHNKETSQTHSHITDIGKATSHL